MHTPVRKWRELHNCSAEPPTAGVRKARARAPRGSPHRKPPSEPASVYLFASAGNVRSLGEQAAARTGRFRCVSPEMHASSLRAGGLVHAGYASSGRAAAPFGALPAVAAAGGRRRVTAGAAASLRPHLLGAGTAAALRQRDITSNVTSERLVASYASPVAQKPYRHVNPCRVATSLQLTLSAGCACLVAASSASPSTPATRLPKFTRGC